MKPALSDTAPAVAEPCGRHSGARVPAGLVHTTDAAPGWRRVRVGDGDGDGDGDGAHFDYRDAGGRPINGAAELARIRKLAIPPAYTDVWICPLANGHLQATGRDARGRKQYRYHADWQRLRGADKFARLEAFGRVLPRIRARVGRDLKPRDGAPVTRTLVLATIVWLLDTTFVRVGNAQYARDNKSYGLTTLRNRHAGLHGHALRLRFRGKSGVMHEVELHDRRVAAVVRRCRQLPGQELFQYQDDTGKRHVVSSGDVNDHLAETAGEGFTAKDFRTWHGSVLALELTRQTCGMAAGGRRDGGAPTTAAERFSTWDVLAQVARRLGNTPAVCRKAYVHPAVLALGGRLAADPAALAAFAATPAEAPPPRGGLSVAERRLAAFLKTAQKNSRCRGGAA